MALQSPSGWYNGPETQRIVVIASGPTEDPKNGKLLMDALVGEFSHGPKSGFEQIVQNHVYFCHAVI